MKRILYFKYMLSIHLNFIKLCNLLVVMLLTVVKQLKKKKNSNLYQYRYFFDIAIRYRGSKIYRWLTLKITVAYETRIAGQYVHARS